ncbi:MAG: hypothetical protein ACPL7O_03710, partial [Armatimonadota bacterium]
QVSQGSTPGRDTKVYIVLGWIFVFVGLVLPCFGFIFTLVGIALGLVAYSKDDNRGLIIAIAGLIVLVLTSAWIIILATKTTPSVLLPAWI